MQYFYDSMLNKPDLAKSIKGKYKYDFSVPTPSYPTSDSLIYAEKTKWTGSFAETAYHDMSEWTDETAPYHNVFREDNSLINM